MMRKLCPLIVMVFVIDLEVAANPVENAQTNKIFVETPCNDTDDIKSYFSFGLREGYNVEINRLLMRGTPIKLLFDMEALITLNNTLASLHQLGNNKYKITLLKNVNKLNFQVQGDVLLMPPNILSFLVYGKENCNIPDLGYFERYPVGAGPRQAIPNPQCGKRKAANQLITNGLISKPGDWPWHAALFRLDSSFQKYICGGTLISEFYVLTAGHCVTRNGIAVLPERLRISLGKHNLLGVNPGSQDKEVEEVIVHEEFNHKQLDNDIALLRMKYSVEFNSFVQPACLWYDKAKHKLGSADILGTVAGWGYDEIYSYSLELREATLPMISDLTCIRSRPLFYSVLLNGKKFCAGHRNGTSACNGDSGGGFVLYVPYDESDVLRKYAEGAWYVRGIVSLSVPKIDTAVCDPNQYVVFTDVAAFTDWIKDHKYDYIRTN